MESIKEEERNEKYNCVHGSSLFIAEILGGWQKPMREDVLHGKRRQARRLLTNNSKEK